MEYLACKVVAYHFNLVNVNTASVNALAGPSLCIAVAKVRYHRFPYGRAWNILACNERYRPVKPVVMLSHQSQNVIIRFLAVSHIRYILYDSLRRALVLLSYRFSSSNRNL